VAFASCSCRWESSASALGTVALPLLTRMAASGNTEAFRSELARGCGSRFS